MKKIRGFIIILLLLCVFTLSSCNIADILPPVDNTDPPVTQDPSGNSTTVCNHSYGEWQIVNPATCEQQGLQERVCTLCTERQEEVIPLTAHTEVTDAAVEATCTQTGLTEGKHCSVCHTVLTTQTEVPMKPHSEVTDAAVEATCTQTGLTEGKHCSACGEVLTAQTVTPALDHTYDDIYDATCNRCGHVREAQCAHLQLTVLPASPPPAKARGLPRASNVLHVVTLLPLSRSFP